MRDTRKGVCVYMYMCVSMSVSRVCTCTCTSLSYRQALVPVLVLGAATACSLSLLVLLVPAGGRPRKTRVGRGGLQLSVEEPGRREIANVCQWGLLVFSSQLVP
ncbi:hypothetical protein EV126DRAFT_414751 [Verticillium dahliae]|nr:hypothetical protein EV126DRAFT_414751 [Verticillium dahliae]